MIKEAVCEWCGKTFEYDTTKYVGRFCSGNCYLSCCNDINNSELNGLFERFKKNPNMKTNLNHMRNKSGKEGYINDD